MKKVIVNSLIIFTSLSLVSFTLPMSVLADHTNKNHREESKKERQDKKEEKRTEKKLEKLDQRQEVLKQLIDLRISHFRRTKERTDRMPNIDQSLKTKLAASIDEVIKKLNDLKVKVDTAKTMAEVKLLAKEVRESFKSHRQVVKEIVDAIHAFKLKNRVTQTEEKLNNLSAKVQEVKNAGKDITQLEQLLISAKNYLTLAKSSLEKQELKAALENLKEIQKTVDNLKKKVRELAQ